jgi:hypothetical protein
MSFTSTPEPNVNPRFTEGRIQDSQRAVTDAVARGDLLNLGDDGISERPARRGLVARVRDLFEKSRRESA